MLNGVGRKVTGFKNYINVQEGEFKNDQLEGWGRSINFYNDGHTCDYVGFFCEGDMQGWGKQTL